jgi:serine/threonine-protein kinase RsbW
VLGPARPIVNPGDRCTVGALCGPSIESLVYERALPATPGGVALVRNELARALERAEIEAERRYEIALVMSEAASNAVLHAYPPLQPGLLFVDAALTAGNLLLRVCDCGGGMRMRTDSPGLGIGLALMGRLCDGLEIARNRSVPGTRVSAMFRAVGPEDPPEVEPPEAATLWEYIAALKATSAALRDDRRALTASAEQALGLAERLRAERGR